MVSRSNLFGFQHRDMVTMHSRILPGDHMIYPIDSGRSMESKRDATWPPK